MAPTTISFSCHKMVLWDGTLITHIDAYKGYHQISMKKYDEEKTTFYINQGLFCYTKMPFGLKNVGATYQTLIYREFRAQIGVNLKAYVNDMVIKSKTEEALFTTSSKHEPPKNQHEAKPSQMYIRSRRWTIHGTHHRRHGNHGKPQED
ncbi:reverse transcriptase domain-containing protein [Tanacetum coccineum]